MRVEMPIIWEHEYFVDGDVGRIHCWFVTYKNWDEHSFDIRDQGKVKHIASYELIRKKEVRAE